MKAPLSTLCMLALLSSLACKAESGKAASSYSTLQHLPLGTPTTADACYHSGRHGDSLRSCEAPSADGVRTTFAQSIRAEPDVRALSEASGAQWVPSSRQVIRVRVTGYFEHSDLDVPGGQRFVITKLHWFHTEAESAQGH